MSRHEVPNSRLFILGGKGATEEEFKETFGKFGNIRDIWIVRDKRTNEDKGITYITFAKASEAALAQEEMNGRMLPGYPKPLKVLIASDRSQGSVREQKEEEKMLRIFIKIPRSYTERDVEDKFKEYGDIDYVNVLQDKHSGESKGLAYVKYHRAYHAALALENCDPTYKAVFAQRKTQSSASRYDPGDFEYGPPPSGYGGYGGHSRAGRSEVDQYTGMGPGMGPVDMLQDYRHSGNTRLEALVSTSATQEQLYRLFDLVPGMEFCDFDRKTGVAFIRYSTPQCAAYAKDKINGIEYPTGYRISIRFAHSELSPSHAVPNLKWNFVNGGSLAENQVPGAPKGESMNAAELNQSLQNMLASPNLQENLQNLVESIKQASTVLQAAGLNTAGMPGGASGANGGYPGGDVRVRYCNVPLPEKQALAPRDANTVERLFIVSQPDSFPEHILNDCMCRFGSLIKAYFMPGRNYGYAKFASKESAEKAIEVLHGQQICGQRLKVMLADPPKYADDPDQPNKKLKTN